MIHSLVLSLVLASTPADCPDGICQLPRIEAAVAKIIPDRDRRERKQRLRKFIQRWGDRRRDK